MKTDIDYIVKKQYSMVLFLHTRTAAPYLVAKMGEKQSSNNKIKNNTKIRKLNHKRRNTKKLLY